MSNILDEINALIPDNASNQVSEADLRASFTKTFQHNFRYQRGWDRLGNPDSLGTIATNDATKIFSIAPKAGQTTFDFWCGGNLYKKSSTETIALDVSSSGAYYVVFNSSGNLEVLPYASVGQNAFMMCITDLYYYNKEDDILWWTEDEQHGIILDPMSHFNLHSTRGFQWVYGAEPVGFTDASSTFTSLSPGVFLDEDIPMFVPEVTTMPFGYKTGVTGSWVITAADNKLGHIASGDTYVSYNKNAGGVWSLEESGASSDYIIYQIMATNFKDMPYFQAVGQQWYASRSAARAALDQHVHAVNLSGTPGAEVKCVYAYICKRNGDLEDSGSPLNETVVDLRGRRMT